MTETPKETPELIIDADEIDSVRQTLNGWGGGRHAAALESLIENGAAGMAKHERNAIENIRCYLDEYDYHHDLLTAISYIARQGGTVTVV